MRIVGLTGDVGAGKSTLCRELAALGAHIIDSDSIARSMWHEKAIQREAEKRWGEDFFCGAGKTEMPARELYAKIAQLIFNNRDEYDFAQNLICRPTIEKIKHEASEAAKNGVVIVEIPLLYEGGHDKWLDGVIYAAASLENRVVRNAKRSWNAEEIKRRENHLMPRDEKIHRADYVLINDGTEEEWRRKAHTLWKELNK